MDILLKNGSVFDDGKFSNQDILISGGKVKAVGKMLSPSNADIIDLNGCAVFSGFVDVHVHLREPGFFYKETIKSGTMACAHGGYTTVFSMPNLNPVPDTLEHLKEQLQIIKNDALINVIPFGSITKGQKGEELSEIELMKDLVCGFSDDGRGVQNSDIMKSAMEKIRNVGKIISAHCEDNSLINGGYIHDGDYARLNGHNGICSKSEYGPILRDIELIKETKCPYHVCHISAKESVEAIRKAKEKGIDITCETAPHYLTLCDNDLKDEGRFKMNPPIRSQEDRTALIQGVIDGTIDIIATDHAPHSKEEKSKGLKNSLMGITGIETAFPVLYTYLCKKGIVSLERIIEMLSVAPRKRFNLPKVEIKEGSIADICVFDLNTQVNVTEDFFMSKGKSSPYIGEKLFGKCMLTVCSGKIVYKSEF